MHISDKIERFILLLAALCIAVFSYFLYDDSLLFSRGDNSGLPTVGTVSLSDRDVRLKSATAFTWFPAAKSDQVRLRDSIFTGENSKARIRLNDGADLELGENSLVTLTETDGQINLDLRFGGVISRAGGKPLNIISGGESYQIEGSGTVNLKRSSSGDIEVSVSEGAARVRTRSGSHSVQQGAPLEINTKGAAKTMNVGEIEAITPDNHQILKMKANDPLATQWKRYPGVKTYEWELCETESCLKPTQKLRSQKTLASTTEQIPPGKYFWRVTGLDARGKKIAASKTQSFEFTVAAPPEILPTETSPVLTREMKIPNLEVTPMAEAELAWKAPQPEVLRYEYELAKTPDFSSILHKAENTTGLLQTPPLENGVYYYHVRSVFEGERRTDWSPAQRLEVNIQASLGEMPGEIRFDQKVFEFDAEIEAARSPSSTPLPRVQWTPAEKAQTYNLEISKDAAFSKPQTVKMTDTEFTWKGYLPGAWYVRVQGISKDDVFGPLSDPARLIVKTDKPTLAPFEKFEKIAVSGAPAPPIEVKAQWTQLPLAKAYRVQISEDADFTAPRQLISRSPSSTVKVEKPGTYFVRVQGLDENGEAITSYSQPQPLEYNYRDPMQPPRLSEPYDRAAIFLQTTEEAMFWLEWTRVTEAKTYEVQIAGDPDFKKILFSSETAEPRVLLQNRVKLGRFYWRVRSRINQEGRISQWSQVRSFVIDSQSAGGFGK